MICFSDSNLAVNSARQLFRQLQTALDFPSTFIGFEYLSPRLSDARLQPLTLSILRYPLGQARNPLSPIAYSITHIANVKLRQLINFGSLRNGFLSNPISDTKIMCYSYSL